MNDLISRQAAIEEVEFGITYAKAFDMETGEARELFKASNEELQKAVERIKALPAAERKKGKWIEKEVIHKEEVDEVIEEWQSCRCSECGRYDTRPYLYFFSKPQFCSWCGADMRGEG